jgi:geranylgeranyl pyrophosphate synthase
MGTKKGQKESEMLVEELKRRSRKALELAKKTILAEKTEAKEVQEALEHYTLHWNDFTHPGLFSIACEAVGANPDSVLPVQAALTMMAAAFDIHDDIIDKSKVKHGVPTVFGKFGKDVALLLGDAFLIEGFMLFDESLAELPWGKIKEALETLKMALFELGSAHALELDMKRGGEVLPDAYMRVLKMKASSIEADMRIGALVGGGTSREVEVLARCGRVLGILGTLREEFVDVFEIDELSQRSRNEYLPIPILYAMQDDKAERKIKSLFAKKKLTNTDVIELVSIVFQARSVRNVKKWMKELVAEAVYSISEIRNIESRTLLQNLASTTLEEL